MSQGTLGRGAERLDLIEVEHAPELVNQSAFPKQGSVKGIGQFAGTME